MIKEAIILAGGLGTRLSRVVPDLPKCMAPVAGKPFLHYVVGYLQKQGVESFIFSLGYMHEVIEAWLVDHYPSLNYHLSVEKEPLGTGGAIQLACKKAMQQQVLVLNGDTMFSIDVHELSVFHQQHGSSCSLALKPMHDFDRYGVVEINAEGYIQSFREKQFYRTGLINGGVYALDVASLGKLNLPDKFSFEKDYLEKYFAAEKMAGLVQDVYFIDIGIPEDFERAGKEFGS